MDFELSESEKKFRDEVRAWLEANKPRGDGASEEGQRDFIESRRTWQKEMYDAGYGGITSPKEYGGRGGGYMEQRSMKDAMMQAQRTEPLTVGARGVGR